MVGEGAVARQKVHDALERAHERGSRRVIITGGSSGIGRASALAFAAEGARVGILSRDEAGIDATVSLARESGHQIAWALADITDGGNIIRYNEVIGTAKSLRDPRTLIDTTLDRPLGNIPGIVTEVRRR